MKDEIIMEHFEDYWQYIKDIFPECEQPTMVASILTLTHELSDICQAVDKVRIVAGLAVNTIENSPDPTELRHAIRENTEALLLIAETLGAEDKEEEF